MSPDPLRVRLAALEEELRRDGGRDYHGVPWADRLTAELAAQWPGQIEREIAGALRSCIDAHGPITKQLIGSAVKRVVKSVGPAAELATLEAPVPLCPFCQRALRYEGWTNTRTHTIWACSPCDMRVEIDSFIPGEKRQALVPSLSQVDSAADLAARLAVPEGETDVLHESNAVCACGCPDAEHENYGEDGEACEHEDHECVRTNRAVLQMLQTLRAEVAALRAAPAADTSEWLLRTNTLEWLLTASHEDAVMALVEDGSMLEDIQRQLRDLFKAARAATPQEQE